MGFENLSALHNFFNSIYNALVYSDYGSYLPLSSQTKNKEIL